MKTNHPLLLVDDEPVIQKAMARILEREGFRVELASEGPASVARYQEQLEAGYPFAATIIDLTLPGGYGGEKVVSEILALDPNARCIVSSGYADNDVIANFQAYGFRRALVKPYRGHELLTAIQAVLEESA
jgi:CheY-like chemotaxis protein